MKEKEEIRTQIGVYNFPRGLSDAGNKVLQIFTKLKRKAKSQSPTGTGVAGTPIRDLMPNLEELRHSAMNSYRIRPEVVKTDNGFEVI